MKAWLLFHYPHFLSCRRLHLRRVWPHHRGLDDSNAFWKLLPSELHQGHAGRGPGTVPALLSRAAEEGGDRRIGHRGGEVSRRNNLSMRPFWIHCNSAMISIMIWYPRLNHYHDASAHLYDESLTDSPSRRRRRNSMDLSNFQGLNSWEVSLNSAQYVHPVWGIRDGLIRDEFGN